MKFLMTIALLALAICVVYAESAAIEEQPREVEEAKRDKRGLLAAPLTAYPYSPYAYASYAYAPGFASPYVAAPAVAAPFAASPGYAAYTYVV